MQISMQTHCQRTMIHQPHSPQNCMSAFKKPNRNQHVQTENEHHVPISCSSKKISEAATPVHVPFDLDKSNNDGGCIFLARTEHTQATHRVPPLLDETQSKANEFTLNSTSFTKPQAFRHAADESRACCGMNGGSCMMYSRQMTQHAQMMQMQAAMVQRHGQPMMMVPRGQHMIPVMHPMMIRHLHPRHAIWQMQQRIQMYPQQMFLQQQMQLSQQHQAQQMQMEQQQAQQSISVGIGDAKRWDKTLGEYKFNTFYLLLFSRLTLKHIFFLSQMVVDLCHRWLRSLFRLQKTTNKNQNRNQNRNRNQNQKITTKIKYSAWN